MSEDKIEDGEEDEKILNELKLVREMTKSVEEKEKFEQK